MVMVLTISVHHIFYNLCKSIHFYLLHDIYNVKNNVKYATKSLHLPFELFKNSGVLFVQFFSVESFV